jgi:hypothetical protein
MVYRRWSPAEITYLVSNHGKMTRTQIAEHLGRSLSAIIHKIQRLKIAKSPTPWLEKEQQILRKFYPCLTREKLLQLLPRRSWKAIETKASLLGLKRDPPVTIKPLSEAQKAYIAGIIDGEGSITIYANTGNYCYFEVTVTNTNIKLINWLKETTGLGKISKDKRHSKLSKKECYKWRVRRKEENLQLLKQIAPYLICKKEKAEKVLSHLLYIPKEVP